MDSRSAANAAAFVAMLFVAACASAEFAQSNAADAAIDGYVRDADGGVHHQSCNPA
jgi:hypothetical protein